MTIGAISGVTTYSSIEQYRVFSAAITNERLVFLMKEYGIRATGNEHEDLLALYAAMYSDIKNNGVSSQNTTQTQEPDSDNVPWAGVMEQVGLIPSGDVDDDYFAFVNRIEELEMASPTYDYTATLEQLLQEASTLFVAPEDNTNSQANNNQMSGAEIKAKINEAFLVG